MTRDQDVDRPPRGRAGPRGFLIRSARVLFLVLVLGLGFHAFGLRPLVASRLRAALDASGSVWSLELRSVAWNRLELDDLRLADGARLRVESLSADYDPLELSRGHVRRLRVVGATWEIRWVDGRPDLGLPALAARDALGRIDRIELVASTIVLTRGDDELRVPVEGRLDWTASDELELEIELCFPGLPLIVRGSLPALGHAGALQASVRPARAGSQLDLLGTLPDGALIQVEGGYGGADPSSWKLALGAALEGGPTLAGRAARGRVSGSLAWTCEVAPDRLRIELEDDSSLAIELEAAGMEEPRSAALEATALPGGTRAWHAGPLAVSLSGEATVARAAGRSSGRFSAASKAVELQGDGLATTIEEATLALAFAGDPERSGPPSLRADLEIGRLIHQSGIELSRIALSCPIPSGPSPAGSMPGEGSASIERVTWRGLSLPGPSATLRSSGATLELEGRWEPTATAALELRGRVDSRAREGELRMTAQGAAIRTGDALEQWLFDRTALHAQADVDLELTLARDEAGARSALSLSARHGSLADMHGAKGLDGIELAIALADLGTPRSAGPATIRWASGRSGELVLGPGALRFALESPRAVLVEAVELATESSRFRIQGFRIDPSAPTASLWISCPDVDLAEWLDLMAAGRVTGEGRMNGWLALELDLAASPPFRLAGGFLDSVGGHLRFDDEEAVRALLDQNLGSYTIEDIDLSQIVRERLVGALSDFDYSSLTLEVIATDDDATLRATLDGQGALVPQEVDMTVNVNGFGSLLTFLLELDAGG